MKLLIDKKVEAAFWVLLMMQVDGVLLHLYFKAARQPPLPLQMSSRASDQWKRGGRWGAQSFSMITFKWEVHVTRSGFLGVLNIKLNRALLELKREVELRSFIRSDGIITQELCTKDNEEPE